MTLYKVTTVRGSGRYGVVHVRETDPTAAYNKVKNYLNDNGICYTSERELKSIEIVATDPDSCGDESLFLD